MMKRCEACGREIEFRKSPSGKMMPVHRVKAIYVPVPGGDGELRRVEISNPVYVSHFETCTDPSRFSRAAGGRS